MKIIEINNMSELFDKLNSFKPNWIFRGQSNNNNSIWELESSLERIVKSSGRDATFMKKCEDYSLDIFMSKVHHYLSFDSIPKTTLSWLSLMQHHGVQTKLLDFSTSPFVSLFFSFSGYKADQNTPVSVFALDYRHILKASIEAIKKNNDQFKYEHPIPINKQDKIFDEYINNKGLDIAWITEPAIMNLRLARQQGTFLLSANTEKYIHEILNSPIYQRADDYFIRYDINIILYKDVKAMLDKMNINYQNLYCDIDGLAKDINLDLKLYSNPS